MKYFDHDTNAMNDDRIVALRIECGIEAVYCYWGILEKMYADEAPVRIAENDPETKALSYRLAVAYQTLSEYCKAMEAVGLLEFSTEDETYTSARAMENIRAYRERCEKARLSGQKGGRKANAKHSLSKRQANAKLRKEKKVVDTYTVSTTTVADGADADKSAPPAPECPLCGTELQATGIASEPWWCNNCSTGFSVKKVPA